MALQMASGSFTVLASDAAAVTHAVSGLGFAPQALFFSWSGRATAGLGEATILWGAGFATSTSSRRCYMTRDEHAAAAAVADSGWRNDCPIAVMSNTGATVGKADIDSFDAGGFTYIIDDQFPADLLVCWVAWGGLTNVGIIDFTEPAATGDQSYNVGFALDTGIDDKAVIILGGPRGAAVNTSAVDSTWTLGFIAGNSPTSAAVAGSSVDAADPTVTCGMCRQGNCALIAFNDLAIVRASSSGATWTSTGFELAWHEVINQSFKFSALVLQGSGARFEIGELATVNDTSNHQELTTYQPVGLLLISRTITESPNDIANIHDERTVGCATGASARWANCQMSKDAQATADNGTATALSSMYYNLSSATTIIGQGNMTLVSFDATPGFTWVMGGVEASPSFIAYLSCAASTAVASALPKLMHYYE